jgi:hypothetical protein
MDPRSNSANDNDINSENTLPEIGCPIGKSPDPKAVPTQIEITENNQ